MVPVNTYDLKTIYYHWFSACLILTIWLIGQNIDSFGKGDPKVFVRSIHITLGLVLAVFFVLRLQWKLTGGVRLAQAVPGLFGKLAAGVHGLLYLLLGLIIVIGIAAVWIRGDNIFNLFHVPVFETSDKQLRDQVVDIHGLLADALLILVSGHAMLAIWHHIILKDGVLKRMWPTLKASASSEASRHPR